jgi:hypothetical protein
VRAARPGKRDSGLDRGCWRRAGNGTWRSGSGDGDGITEEKEARISNPRNAVKDARI